MAKKFKVVSSLKTTIKHPFAELEETVKMVNVKAFSRWQERMLPFIKANTPVNKDVRQRGFVNSHIGLMIRQKHGYKYKVVGVPGGSKKGSSAYNALMAIYAHHGLARKSPLTITAKPGKVLAFPLKPGETIRNKSTAIKSPHKRNRKQENWVITKKVVIDKWASNSQRNPWFTTTFTSDKAKEMHKNQLAYELRKEIKPLQAKRRIVKIATA